MKTKIQTSYTNYEANIKNQCLFYILGGFQEDDTYTSQASYINHNISTVSLQFEW